MSIQFHKGRHLAVGNHLADASGANLYHSLRYTRKLVPFITMESRVSGSWSLIHVSILVFMYSMGNKNCKSLNITSSKSGRLFCL